MELPDRTVLSVAPQGARGRSEERARARAVDQAAEIPEIGNRILFSFLLVLGTSRAEFEIGSLIEFKLRSQAHMGAYSPPVTPP